MIPNGRTAANQWSPDGFERFRQRYPATNWQPLPVGLDRTRRFLALWDGGSAADEAGELAVVLTPGLFAEFLPFCFHAASSAFETRGHRVLKTSVRSGLAVREQAERLCRRILDWLDHDERFIWCTHSKGGLEALWALEQHAALRERCVATVVMQLPVGDAWVIGKLCDQPDSAVQRVIGRVLRQRWFADGVAEVSGNRDPAIANWLQGFVPKIPVLAAVSWSLHATGWVDSWHRQLNALRPGHAHDGQFYLVDQLLPATPVVCLPDLDHAQPVLGGQGLDVGRLWRTLVAVALEDAALRPDNTRQTPRGP